MDLLTAILNSPVFWGILVLLIAASKEKRNILLSEIASFSKEKVQTEAGNSLVKQGGALYSYSGKYQLVDENKLHEAYKMIVAGLAKIAKTIDDSINTHIKSILSTFGAEGNRAWKVLGYLTQLILLIAFFIADIIQTLNSLAIYYPEEIAKISYILDYLPLPIAIVMASVGTALALGIIVSDFAGVTHFGDWGDLKGAYRIFIQALTYITLITAVGIAVIINLSKVVSIPDISASLSVELVEAIKFWAGVAQNVVIFPLYATTFLFFSGMKGIVVLYLFGVAVISFVVKILYGIIWMLTVLVVRGGAKGIEIAFKLVLFLLAIALVIFGSLFVGAGIIFAFLFTVIQKILEFVFFPADILFDKLWNYLLSSRVKI